MRPCLVRVRAFFVGISCEAMELSEIGDDFYFVKGSKGSQGSKGSTNWLVDASVIFSFESPENP